jgi:hypothetical protein
VYNKQLTEIKERANSNGVSSNSLFWELSVGDEKGHSASEQEVLSNLSIGMSLTLARAFGGQSKFIAT